MTNEQLNQAGFIVSGTEIEPTYYRYYLDEYGKDETTTPRGVGDRTHIREVTSFIYRDCNEKEIWEDEYNSLEQSERDNYYPFGECTKEWQIWSWGVNGNHPHFTGTSFDNEEDAKLYYYERCEWFISEKNWDAPKWNSSYEEAVQEMADSNNRPVEVMERYLKLQAITKRKDAERIAKITAENEKRKAWLSVEIPKEAASLIIDNEFKEAVKWATQVTGREKSNRMASALKGLLSRNNKSAINTDFWQVLRILKNEIN
jgi:hypothetical protein